jgi:hypothetical protein
MNIFSYVKQYVDQINGQFTEYDHTKAIVVVPTADGRFQTVLLTLETSKSSASQMAVLSSKVCEYNAGIDLKNLLEQNATFDYSKFTIDGGYLKIEASCLSSAASEEELKHMIQEVAKMADAYEMKLTGKDIN